MPDINGTTALMFSALEGKTEVVQLLLQFGADKDLACPDGTTALMLAAASGLKATDTSCEHIKDMDMWRWKLCIQTR